MEQTVACIKPISGRHIPYRLENGNLMIENDILLIIDELDNSICACKTTPTNLALLGVIPITESSSSCNETSELDTISEYNVTSHSEVTESQLMEPKQMTNNFSGETKKWSKDAVLFLIDQCQKNGSKFASTTIRNEDVWKDIIKKLEDAGFIGFTWKQAQDKWKNLRKGYMKVKDNKSDKSSGAARITCKFYDELDEIFTKSPSVKPISIASSNNFKRLPDQPDDSDSEKDLHPIPSKKKKENCCKEIVKHVYHLLEQMLMPEKQPERYDIKKH